MASRTQFIAKNAWNPTETGGRSAGCRLSVPDPVANRSFSGFVRKEGVVEAICQLPGIMEVFCMLRSIWISGVVCAALLGGLVAVPRAAHAQGLWLGGVGFGGPGFYGSGFSPYGVGGWGGVGGFVPVRAAYPAVVSRPVVVAPRPVVVAPTPSAYRHANRVVRRVWRRGW